MKLCWRTHKTLEEFCKTVCTRKIGWNRQRRKDCRNNTMCQECKRLLDAANGDVVRLIKYKNGNTYPNVAEYSDGFKTFLHDNGNSSLGGYVVEILPPKPVEKRAPKDECHCWVVEERINKGEWHYLKSTGTREKARNLKEGFLSGTVTYPEVSYRIRKYVPQD